MRKFRETMLDAWEWLRIDVKDLSPLNEDWVFAYVRFMAKGKTSGMDEALRIAGPSE